MTGVEGNEEVENKHTGFLYCPGMVRGKIRVDKDGVDPVHVCMTTFGTDLGATAHDEMKGESMMMMSEGLGVGLGFGLKMRGKVLRAHEVMGCFRFLGWNLKQTLVELGLDI